ncbi:MAG: HAD-IA family hydrolase [Spirochaetales bacterium]|nr:HAD-IA family hydrolase [Spirochaetales bacterium]
MKLSHIGIIVNDLYAMQLFYTHILGFKQEYGYVSSNTPGLKTVFLRKAHMSLELLHGSETKHPGNGFHISFHVRDVDKEAARLRDAGIQIVKGPRTTGDGYRELEIKDPEGNSIEISKRTTAKPRYPIRAVIFDLDGTVIDSEDNYHEADRLLLKHYGIHFTKDMKKGYIGMGNRAMMAKIIKTYSIPATVEQMTAVKNKLYLKLALANTNVFSRMLKLIKKLFAKQLPLALATGSSPEIVVKLTKLLQIKQYFKVMLSADHVGKSKPEPDLFLAAAKKLKVAPQNCVVIEDSMYGVEAAKRAFMRCIGIPSVTEKPLAPAFATADLLFKHGMKTFNYRKAFRWIKQRM